VRGRAEPLSPQNVIVSPVLNVPSQKKFPFLPGVSILVVLITVCAVGYFSVLKPYLEKQKMERVVNSLAETFFGGLEAGDLEEVLRVFPVYAVGKQEERVNKLLQKLVANGPVTAAYGVTVDTHLDGWDLEKIERGIQRIYGEEVQIADGYQITMSGSLVSGSGKTKIPKRSEAVILIDHVWYVSPVKSYGELETYWDIKEGKAIQADMQLVRNIHVAMSGMYNDSSVSKKGRPVVGVNQSFGGPADSDFWTGVYHALGYEDKADLLREFKQESVTDLLFDLDPGDQFTVIAVGSDDGTGNPITYPKGRDTAWR
jgi:hypothetical protein